MSGQRDNMLQLSCQRVPNFLSHFRYRPISAVLVRSPASHWSLPLSGLIAELQLDIKQNLLAGSLPPPVGQPEGEHSSGSASPACRQFTGLSGPAGMGLWPSQHLPEKCLTLKLP